MSQKTLRRREWEAFVKLLDSNIRITNFDNAYKEITRVTGLYDCEAKAVWNFLDKHQPKSIVEIGRCLGGSLWLYGCVCNHLKKVLSIDIEDYELSDQRLKNWYENQGIICDIVVEDSTKWKVDNDEMWDFVFIDGGHTGPIVKEDINIWKDHCRYIGFHDYADQGIKNTHKKIYRDVINEITYSAKEYGWTQVGERGRSEIVFKTKNK